MNLAQVRRGQLSGTLTYAFSRMGGSAGPREVSHEGPLLGWQAGFRCWVDLLRGHLRRWPLTQIITEVQVVLDLSKDIWFWLDLRWWTSGFNRGRPHNG